MCSVSGRLNAERRSRSRRYQSKMPTVSENLEIWGQYDWPDQGDVWSQQFGGTEALWSFTLYPRIQRFLPASSILEIAPGYGRWTQFLQRLCQSMVAVDI